MAVYETLLKIFFFCSVCLHQVRQVLIIDLIVESRAHELALSEDLLAAPPKRCQSYFSEHSPYLFTRDPECLTYNYFLPNSSKMPA